MSGVEGRKKRREDLLAVAGHFCLFFVTEMSEANLPLTRRTVGLPLAVPKTATGSERWGDSPAEWKHRQQGGCPSQGTRTDGGERARVPEEE